MNFELNITQNILLFLISGAIIWYFSNKLSSVVEFIDNTFGLGDAFGGTIMLSIITNLPELVIVVVGVLKGDTALALGNILGGIAMQTLLLVLFDFASKKEKRPLSTLTSHPNSIVQGLFLCIILAMVIIGSQFNQKFVTIRTSPVELLIFISWISSLLILKKSEKSKILPKVEDTKIYNKPFTRKSALIELFVIAIIILFFGVTLAQTSENIADHFGISGVIFGATVLAFVTSLPEISGGLAFVKHKKYIPIIGDILGGNSFLPVLFFLANLLAGRSILTDAHKTDIYLTSLSIVMALIFVAGMVIKSNKRQFGLGIDSWIMLLSYIAGMIGLMFI